MAANLDVASVSHRQPGVWAGGSGARASWLGSAPVQARDGAIEGVQSLSQVPWRLGGEASHNFVDPFLWLVSIPQMVFTGDFNDACPKSQSLPLIPTLWLQGQD